MPCKALVKQAPLLLTMLFPLLVGGSLLGCERQSGPVLAPESEPTVVANDQELPGITPISATARSEYEQNSIDVFKALAPSVVFVTNKQVRRDMWSRRKTEVTAGAGTGFIWDKRGHIVTNYHVVSKGSSFEVKLDDGTTLPAKFVGGDPNKDIAVLKIVPKKSMHPVTLPSASSEVEVGQKAVAIGNPFGLDHTLTVGVISATGRERVGFGGVTIRDMLQTDASINPGNSGGPLLDSQGRLIGMNTMIASSSGSSAGIGFAVPVSAIRKVVPDVIRYGKVKRAGLGIELWPDSRARQGGIPRGVVISKVSRKSSAARAGLQGLKARRDGYYSLGDVIVGIDSYPVNNYDQLYNALDRYQAGDTVDVTVLRDSKKVKVSLTLMQLE